MSNVVNGNVSDTGLVKGRIYGTGSLKGGVSTLLARDGYSAYEVAVNNGFEGTVEEWLLSLKGRFAELTDEEKASLKGAKGDPFTYADFTEAQLAALKGEKGDAFTFEDFTEDELAMLKGETGLSGVYVGSGDMPEGFSVQIDPAGSGYSIDEIETEIAERVKADLRASAVARIGYVELKANAWSGANSPYSQVVSIPTVTPSTQVDLTPSVEQLAVFHNKDLAFVTENEDGAVTVYAIGQKPENDYTIQVTMTEVDV